MPEQSYSPTEAADALGVSTPTAKKMVRNRKLRGWKTPGGHLRIAVESVRQFLEGGGSSTEGQRREPSSTLQNRREHLEEVNLSNQELRALRETRKLQREDAVEIERELQETTRKEKQQHEQERLDSQEQQLVRRNQEQRRIEGQRDQLERERATQERERRNKERQNAIVKAEGCLDPWAKSAFSPTTWQIQLRRQVREALAELPLDASAEEISDTATEAGQAVAKEYEEAEAAKEKKQSRERAQQSIESDTTSALWHVSTYLRQLESDGNFTFDDKYRLTEKLEKRIRPELREEIRSDPDLGYQDQQEIVEDLVDDHLPEFVDDEED